MSHDNKLDDLNFFDGYEGVIDVQVRLLGQRVPGQLKHGIPGKLVGWGDGVSRCFQIEKESESAVAAVRFMLPWSRLNEVQRERLRLHVFKAIQALAVPAAVRQEVRSRKLSREFDGCGAPDVKRLAAQIYRLMPETCAENGWRAVEECTYLKELADQTEKALSAAGDPRKFDQGIEPVACAKLLAILEPPPQSCNESTALKTFTGLKAYKTPEDIEESRLKNLGDVVVYQTEQAVSDGTFYRSVRFGASSELLNPALGGRTAYIAVRGYPHSLAADLTWSASAVDSSASIKQIASFAGFVIAAYSGKRPSSGLAVPLESASPVVKAGDGEHTLALDETLGAQNRSATAPDEVQTLLQQLKLPPIAPLGTKFIGPIDVNSNIRYVLSIQEKAPAKPSKDGSVGPDVKQTITMNPRYSPLVTLTAGVETDLLTDGEAYNSPRWIRSGVPGGATMSYKLEGNAKYSQLVSAFIGLMVGLPCENTVARTVALFNLGVPLTTSVPLPQTTVGLGVRFSKGAPGVTLSINGGLRFYDRAIDRAYGNEIVLASTQTPPSIEKSVRASAVFGAGVSFDLGVAGKAIGDSVVSLFK